MTLSKPELSSGNTLKRKASSTVGRGKVVNINTNLDFSTWSDEFVTLYLGDSLEHYKTWESPTVALPYLAC